MLPFGWGRRRTAMGHSVTTVHGGLDAGELRSLGLRPDEVLDFSANINPLGPSQRVRQAVLEADLSAYPDRHCLALREAIAAQSGVGIENLLYPPTPSMTMICRWILRFCGFPTSPTSMISTRCTTSPAYACAM